MAILFMYMSGALQQAAALGDRQHGQRVRHGLGADGRALERIDGDVDLRALADADLLADVEHRASSISPSPMTTRPLIWTLASSLAHGIDGGLVGGLLVAAAAQPRRGDRGRLGHARDLEHQDAVEPPTFVLLDTGPWCSLPLRRSPIRL